MSGQAGAGTEGRNSALISLATGPDLLVFLVFMLLLVSLWANSFPAIKSGAGSPLQAGVLGSGGILPFTLVGPFYCGQSNYAMWTSQIFDACAIILSN